MYSSVQIKLDLEERLQFNTLSLYYSEKGFSKVVLSLKTLYTNEIVPNFNLLGLNDARGKEEQTFDENLFNDPV